MENTRQNQRGGKSWRGRGARGRGRGSGAYQNELSGTQPEPIVTEVYKNPKLQGENKNKSKWGKKEFKPTEVVPDLAPKAKSHAPSEERNDPLINDMITIEGVNGFVQAATEREFQLDYSQFNELVRASYDAATTFDRGLRKYVSFSMYQYYNTILLWKRLFDIVSSRGHRTVEALDINAILNIDLVVPQDVNLYLSGMGDLHDPSGREFHLAIQTPRFSNIEIDGAEGFYGVINDGNHVIYETLPSPGIALLKIGADIDFVEDVDPDWDLPEEVRPALPAAVMPNANLLGWRRREKLTDDQKAALTECGIVEGDFGVRNVHGLPINVQLMRYVSNAIENSKTKSIATFPNSTKGSCCQVPFSTRSREDTEMTPYVNIAAKQMRSNSYCQFSSHIASGSAIMRYRIQRRSEAVQDDMLCYRFVHNEVPPAWLGNVNMIFEFGIGQQLWNTSQFRISEQQGLGLVSSLANRVRRKVVRD